MTLIARKMLLDTELIPDSTKNMLVILPNFEGYGFRLDCYIDEYLQDKIQEQDFKTIIAKANREASVLYQKKRSEEYTDFNIKVKKIMWIAILSSVIAFIMLAKTIWDDCLRDESADLEYCGQKETIQVSLFLLALTALLSIIVVLTGLITSPTFIDLESELIRVLNEYFDKQNQELQNNTLTWKLGERALWLELHIQ